MQEYSKHIACDPHFKPSVVDTVRQQLLQVSFVAAAVRLSWDPTLLSCYISCSEASRHSLAYQHAAQQSSVSKPTK